MVKSVRLKEEEMGGVVVVEGEMAEDAKSSYPETLEVSRQYTGCSINLP